jgi:hypothetical protein
MMIRKLVILTAAAALVACQGPAGKDGSNGAVGEVGDLGETGIAGGNGSDGNDLAAPEAAVAAVTPNVLLAGRSTTIRVVGYFTEWSETTTVNFSDSEGNVLDSVQSETISVSPVGLVVTVTVAADTALGAVAMNIVNGDNTLTYAPEGAQVVVAATAVSSQSELRAGEDFDIMLEVPEYMRNPILNTENCVAMFDVEVGRYSQYKFNVRGSIHPASALGDCALSLVQDAETDDEWVSAGIVTITAPDVITFNDGSLSGELTAERPYRTIAISAAAGDVISVRHTSDTENGLDGTGSAFSVFLEGNLEPIAVHPGSDSWLEIANVEARELLFVVAEELEEGDEAVSFNLTAIVPNTAMTALQDGATQTQRLPANGDGVVEAGRASWYTITNDAAVWATIGLAATNEDALQSGMVLFVDDMPVAMGTTEWAGVLPAGVTVLKVLDSDYDAEDGVLEFALELARSEMSQLDENGTGNDTLETGDNNRFIVEVPEGRVAHFAATADSTLTVNAYWLGNDVPVASGENGVYVPSAAGGQLLISVGAEGDLGNGLAYTAQLTMIEPTALDLEAGATGSAPEQGAVWYMTILESSAILTINLAAGNAEHLQSAMTLYAANGTGLMNGGTSVRALVTGTFFLAVRDSEFVADQDQSFTLSTESNNNPADVACFNLNTLDVGDTERGEFEYSEDVSNSVDFYPRNSANDAVVSITLTNPATIDLYTASNWDPVLYVLSSCGQDWGQTLGFNDDGYDWNGNRLGVDSGLNGISLPAGTSFVVVTGYGGWSRVGPVTIHYRLRDAQ